MAREGPFPVQYGGFKTLPLYYLRARLLEPMAAFSKARASIENIEPAYTPASYTPSADLLSELARDPTAASIAIKRWHEHVANFMYYVQFKDDPSRALTRAVHDHTETLSILCDSRLKLDPTPLWKTFDGLLSVATVHFDYRGDPERDEKWDHYANRLKQMHSSLCEHDRTSVRLIQRMIKQVELRAAEWPSLPTIHSSAMKPADSSTVELFYSYSHKDEALRDQLDAHLALLKRQGVITDWYDRRISAGREWKGEIDDHLNTARLILLLVSADFLASDYCCDVELARAMQRHDAGDARVVPVILRACDWHDATFGKLQAIPKDGKPVTSWPNIDEALLDVARGIRAAVNDLTSKG